jgi:hypothetical protein
MRELWHVSYCLGRSGLETPVLQGIIVMMPRMLNTKSVWPHGLEVTATAPELEKMKRGWFVGIACARSKTARASGVDMARRKNNAWSRSQRTTTNNWKMFHNSECGMLPPRPRTSPTIQTYLLVSRAGTPPRAAVVQNMPTLRSRVSDLLCMTNLAHASPTKEHDDNDDFQGTTGRAA